MRLAHSYVATAIYHGDLPKLDGSVKCVDCGDAANEYDHRDYKKPMEVEPVCMGCNQLRGPGVNAFPAEGKQKRLSRLKRHYMKYGEPSIKAARIQKEFKPMAMNTYREEAGVRRQNVLALHKKGVKQGDIAAQVGLTRERVRQIINAAKPS